VIRNGTWVHVGTDEDFNHGMDYDTRSVEVPVAKFVSSLLHRFPIPETSGYNQKHEGHRRRRDENNSLYPEDHLDKMWRRLRLRLVKHLSRGDALDPLPVVLVVRMKD
jgi:hypothetical protein